MSKSDGFRKSKNSWSSLLYIWNNEALHQSGFGYILSKSLAFPKSKEIAKLVHDSATFVEHIPVILKLIFILSFLYAFQDNSSPGRKELIEREQTKKYIYTF